MRWDDSTHTSPCAKCPYRKDAPLRLWHPDHFRTLLANDADPLGGAVYGCHNDRKREQSERRPCVGWLLDQKKRRVPSIRLRMVVMTSDAAMVCMESIHAAGLKLYGTIKSMCRANGVRPPTKRTP